MAGALILLSGTAAVAASAATASSHPSPTIRGCVSTKTDALTVLLKAGAKCRRGTKALSWNTALFGAKTNQAAAGTGGTQCTLGEIILTAGKTALPDLRNAAPDGLTYSICEFGIFP